MACSSLRDLPCLVPIRLQQTISRSRCGEVLLDACRILRSLCWGIVGISLPVVYPCAVTLVISQVILSLPPQQVLPCNDTPALHPVRPSRAGLCRRAFEMQRTPACRQSRLLTPEADTVDHLHAQHTVAQRIRSPPAGPARPHMVGAHIDLKPVSYTHLTLPTTPYV